jgi:hypothetical protein
MILGDSFLRRFTTSFDLRQRRLGFGVSASEDLGMELAEALFPDTSPDLLVTPMPSAHDAGHGQIARDALEAMPGLLGHLSSARKLRGQSEKLTNM